MLAQTQPKDLEAELSNVQRVYQKLAPLCSVAKRTGVIPQLATQEKQMDILSQEFDETMLCIKLASKGQHAIHDAAVKHDMGHSITEYEQLETELRDERAQQAEVDLLNYLAQKRVVELSKKLPTEADELAYLENANNRLRRMENRLDLANKRFCVVNAENKQVREEINRLLVERNNFNLQWRRTIGKLVKGKEYLMDILEIASQAFRDRDEWCKKLETLKWKGLFQLNKDISEMQSYDGDLKYLVELEDYLRVKGSLRVCESSEKEEMKRLEEIARCEQEITKYDAMLDEIFAYTGTNKVNRIIANFEGNEIENFSLFIHLCELLQESIVLRKELDVMRQRILDQHDINEAREEQQDKRISELIAELNEQRNRMQDKIDQNYAADVTFNEVLKGVEELVRTSECDFTPLLCLLGNNRELTKWNVSKFLKFLEIEVKSLIQVMYGSLTPPSPTPKGKRPETPTTKAIADPYVQTLRPNRLDLLVPYQPCAYCVEDYIMNMMYETPAVLADKESIEEIFHLEKVNTKFGIYSLTIPTKRHPFRSSLKENDA